MASFDTGSVVRIRIFSHSFLNNYFIFGFVAFAETRPVSGSARIEVIFTQQGLIEGNFKLYQIVMNVEHINYTRKYNCIKIKDNHFLASKRQRG